SHDEVDDEYDDSTPFGQMPTCRASNPEGESEAGEYERGVGHLWSWEREKPLHKAVKSPRSTTATLQSQDEESHATDNHTAMGIHQSSGQSHATALLAERQI